MPYPLFENPPTALSVATKMVETVRTERLDLLHVHYAVPHATSGYLAKQMYTDVSESLGEPSGLKVITTLHGTDITLVGINPSYHAITRFSIVKSDGVTAVSRFLHDETVEKFGVERPIEVIPNFVDIDRFSRVSCQGKRRRYALDDQQIVMHISNFRPVKRPVEVVEIFAKIHRRTPAKLLMIGDGPLRSACHERAQELNVLKDTWFLGRQEEVESLLGLADVFLLPSDTESFGLAALEAMSCEVPVVATRTGGLPEMVVDGVTGVLADVGDIEGMAEGALEIFGNSQSKANMGKASRERAMSMFEEEAVVIQYEDYYKKVMAEDAVAVTA
jgi:N-acetyl-alpha-D-glucosaminyl L-malate synthase BshA